MEVSATITYVLVAGAISIHIVGRLFQRQRRYSKVILARISD